MSVFRQLFVRVVVGRGDAVAELVGRGPDDHRRPRGGGCCFQEPGWSSIILFSLEIGWWVRHLSVCYSGARRREGTFQSYRRLLLTMLSNAPKRMMRMRAPTMTVSACWMASDGVIVFLHGAVSNCPCQTVIQVDWRGKEVFTLGLK